MPSVEAIRRAVPSECFRISTTKSVGYLLFDLSLISAAYWLEPYFETYGGLAGLFIWYWLMGLFGTTLFAIGHDCVHGAFSARPFVNSLMGHIVYAPILISYWPFEKSHFGHHNYTNHISKDFGHHWSRKEDFRPDSWISRTWAFWKSPVAMLVKFIVLYQALGLPDGSHYWPWSKMFETRKERIQCAVSTSACLFSMTIAFLICDCSCLLWVKYYIGPVMFTSYWIMMISYLEHHEPDTEVYSDGAWNFMKGQLQTVDRRYGFGVDWILHHLTDGHVAHHLFRKIPHYNLPKATEAIRSYMDIHYPGSYKLISSYDHAWESVRLNWVQEFLIPVGEGTFKYPRTMRDSSRSCAQKRRTG